MCEDIATSKLLFEDMMNIHLNYSLTLQEICSSLKELSHGYQMSIAEKQAILTITSLSCIYITFVIMMLLKAGLFVKYIALLNVKSGAGFLVSSHVKEVGTSTNLSDGNTKGWQTYSSSKIDVFSSDTERENYVQNSLYSRRKRYKKKVYTVRPSSVSWNINNCPGMVFNSTDHCQQAKNFIKKVKCSKNKKYTDRKVDQFSISYNANSIPTSVENFSEEDIDKHDVWSRCTTESNKDNHCETEYEVDNEFTNRKLKLDGESTRNKSTGDEINRRDFDSLNNPMHGGNEKINYGTQQKTFVPAISGSCDSAYVSDSRRNDETEPKYLDINSKLDQAQHSDSNLDDLTESYQVSMSNITHVENSDSVNYTLIPEVRIEENRKQAFLGNSENNHVTRHKTSEDVNDKANKSPLSVSLQQSPEEDTSDFDIKQNNVMVLPSKTSTDVIDDVVKKKQYVMKTSEQRIARPDIEIDGSSSSDENGELKSTKPHSLMLQNEFDCSEHYNLAENSNYNDEETSLKDSCAGSLQSNYARCASDCGNSTMSIGSVMGNTTRENYKTKMIESDDLCTPLYQNISIGKRIYLKHGEIHFSSGNSFYEEHHSFSLDDTSSLKDITTHEKTSLQSLSVDSVINTEVKELVPTNIDTCQYDSLQCQQMSNDSNDSATDHVNTGQITKEVAQSSYVEEIKEKLGIDLRVDDAISNTAGALALANLASNDPYNWSNLNEPSLPPDIYEDVIPPARQLNRPIYERLKRIDWVMGYFSTGGVIDVFVDLEGLDIDWVMQELCRLTGQPPSKFNIKDNNEEMSFLD